MNYYVLLAIIMSIGDVPPAPYLHSGGRDLRFPHHENEIAQSQALFDCDRFFSPDFLFLGTEQTTLCECEGWYCFTPPFLYFFAKQKSHRARPSLSRTGSNT